jgi:hypothetical protein
MERYEPRESLANGSAVSPSRSVETGNPNRRGGDTAPYRSDRLYCGLHYAKDSGEVEFELDGLAVLEDRPFLSAEVIADKRLSGSTAGRVEC